MSKILRNWQSASAQIASGSSLSASLVIAGRSIINILMPTAWTAASLSFDISACPGGTFYPLYDTDGAEIAIPVAASQGYSGSDLAYLAGWYGMRIRSGSTVTDVDDQAAARTLVISMSG